MVSCFAITEPQGGSDPLGFRMTAVEDGDHYVLNRRSFTSNARFAGFFIVMAVTDPDAADRYRRIDVHRPRGHARDGDRPELWLLRRTGAWPCAHALDRRRVPRENMLGRRGEAFVVAQVRLGGGRLRHRDAHDGRGGQMLDMMCERALSRTTKGEQLARSGWCRGSLPTRGSSCASSALHPGDRVAGQPGQRLEGDPQERFGGEGRDAPRCCTTSARPRCRSTGRWG
ncbi:acyl-CoA dehydrogenase family protein [Sphingomonas sp. MMS24-JH45]